MMHQLFTKRNTPKMSENEDNAHCEATAIDEDWQMVAPPSESAPTTDAHEQSSHSEQPRGSFLPLTEASRSAQSPPDSYAAKLKTGISEQEDATIAMNRLTASVQAQSADLTNAVKKLNQERELLAKERKRLQDKNITEQAEIHAQLNRQVIAMHNSVVAKGEEERQKLHDELKSGFDADMARMSREFQVALDEEAKKRRRVLEEVSDRVVEDRKASETRISAVQQQCQALQQQVSSVEQRVSGVEQCLRPRSQETRPTSSQQERRPAIVGYERSRPTGPTGPAPRSRMDVNAANAAAQRQRAENQQGRSRASEDTVRAHAAHMASGRWVYDCELCA
ncbi:hypothetical protein CLAFUW4_09188 [Fulvia fulva]|uniref:Uncharacterized protein n=1 Tax=Passalora fulva TaxID=5499 RepID=A0A9Q8PGG7_PASFU|nr:uncharacterized protein CLAFUR5_09288 [Fulvia fulva]KAK4613461.1 hypothetical protein CLAFUR4_09194 [Fulvia fulva]KAK4614438.1 hypothetical protein CLAFUR0_09186 [Fulvia fulva]UJO22038.1 hypothetical protein CLAFUR5_09288 [Fulvia fulva]WPV20204.1 hypothetical protein CLAFUW4_09188 [Fulvia fulva]WPV34823.1 hypothetical protein CLAFUW7_09189 [Fulvia fulva]